MIPRPFEFLLLTSLGVTSFFSTPSSLKAQEEQEAPRIRPLIYYEALNLVADDTTKSRVDFNFNIPHDFFVFVRSTTNPNDFVARGEITVEVLDSSGVSVARDIIHKELHRTEMTSSEGKRHGAVHGDFSFSLGPGTYHAIFEVNDLESKRRIVDKNQRIVLKKFSDSSPGISGILFLDRVKIGDDSVMKVFPLNLGGDAIFGKNFTLGFQATGARDTSEVVHYSIHKLDLAGKRISVLSDSARPISKFSNSRLIPLEGDSILVYAIRQSNNPPEVKTYLVDIRGDTLQLGKYDVEIKGSGNSVARKSFAIQWIDMPLTLANNVLSTEALRYLMPEKEFDEFMKLSPEEMKKQFDEFWKKRDPTPQTAYNEAMAEYYQRCDYALENFGTLRQANGIKTDRGKIYILYGPPAKTERLLTPGTPPKEIWYYDNLGMKFIFVDESRAGNYKLLSSEKL